MGQRDSCSKKFLNRAEVFADVCNVFLFNGKEVVRPENLSDKSGEEIYVPKLSRSRSRPLAVSRDLLKDVVCRTVSNGTTHLLVGIESQSEQDNSMALRDLFYDVLQYMDQMTRLKDARRLALKNGKKGKGGKASGKGAPHDSFISRMGIDDRLTPVITFVLYMSPKPWNGPRSFRDLLALSDSELSKFKDYIVDYRLNIIEPCNLTDEMFACFKSDLGPVLKIQKLADKKEKLLEYLEACPSSLRS